jgi:hypothetical protein
MQSPIGSHALLQSVTLEEGLKAYVCPETQGHWIPAKNYWEWQSQLPAATDHHPSLHTEPAGEFEDTVKVCPESGTDSISGSTARSPAASGSIPVSGRH